MSFHNQHILLALAFFVLFQETVSLVFVKSYRRYFAGSGALSPTDTFSTFKLIACVQKFQANGGDLDATSYFRYNPSEEFCVIGVISNNHNVTLAPNSWNNIPIMASLNWRQVICFFIYFVDNFVLVTLISFFCGQKTKTRLSGVCPLDNSQLIY